MKSLNGIGLLLFRLFLGGRLLYGVLDKVFQADKMAELVAFLDTKGVPFADFAGPISIYAQLICAILFIIGFETRFVAGMMVVNFLVALFAFDITNSIEGMTPTLAMLFGSLLLLFEGAGRFSLDNSLKRE